jgi:hypothetical protein
MLQLDVLLRFMYLFPLNINEHKLMLVSPLRDVGQEGTFSLSGIIVAANNLTVIKRLSLNIRSTVNMSAPN